MNLSTLTPAEQVAVFAVSAPLIYLATVAAGRWLKRHERVHLSIMYKLFGVTLALLIPLWVLGWYDAGNQYHQDLFAASLLLGVIFLLSLLKRYLWEFYFGEKRGMDIPKFLREIFSALFLLIALVLVGSRIYGIKASPLLLSSTVVVGIIGWAMQDLLGNVISGVALQLGRPFKAGDWLMVDTQHAEVIEVNWRSTKLRTNDDHYLDIPNSAIVRTTIVNLSYPTHLHAMRMRVGLDYDAPPNKVKQVLLDAACSAPGVLSVPPPKVFLVEFADSAVTYEIKFWLQNHSAYNEVNDSLRTAVWYGLQRAKIGIPFPIRTVHVERKKVEPYRPPEEMRAVIRNKPFFKCLTDDQIARLVGAATVSLFGRGERIVEQGATGSSMFILLTGEADVYVRSQDPDAEPTRVATLQLGDYFGEMSLLTGEARSATISANSDCQVLEISKYQFAQLLQENSTLLNKLSEMLAQRRMDNEGVLASTAERHTLVAKQEEYAAGFLKNLARFFDL